ncbi:hypothetical protein L21SP5_02438 [Salinivirga cyanobacteriivorans]|uniref:T9SS C-terminal target domain-containing protein n=1 Tax=Salinivirga cyanobacteriivorans TaxID=1307839 RepID=A0A0S2I168_9BACT|nr:T9SS type A sorting domain-containing protein [Salinivirga cyanobacteriivorans]ALO16065.1 hypothetical protein L21SP5_02438 [Salinivirga cyanobacteriivorans]
MKKLNIILILIFIFSLAWNRGFAEKYLYAKKGNKKEIKSVGAGCLPPTSSRYLQFNNVKAMIHNGGDMWWDFNNAQYFVPKSGQASALFAGSIWVGGKDSNGQLRLAGHRFRGVGVDFYPGPLVAEGPNKGNVSAEICTRYDRQYYITKSMVSEFIAYSQSENPDEEFPEYTIPEVITNWPAHGPTEDQYDYFLAPFKDVDGDETYDPGAGDYPYYIFDSRNYDCNTRPVREAEGLTNETMQLFGDATLWWVYNDRGNIHTETQGDAIGMEFRAQAFAFATNDELNNMTFYNYQIINRSSFTLNEAYFGVWTDADMGYAFDDFVGTDVVRGLGYLYNGELVDGDGEVTSYGANPPAIGIDFFEGPYKDPTFEDDLTNWNPDGELDCDIGYRYDADGNMDTSVNGSNIKFNGNINGLNFGDGIADNERWGMRRFIYFNNAGGDYGDPVYAHEYYKYLTGYWKNGKRMNYGGTGYDGTTEIDADFMFPGLTDKCDWGTGGETPANKNWTEQSENNTADDRRFVQSAGPFTLEPGNVNNITTGAVWARSYENSLLASAEKVRKADDKAQALFENCFQLIDGPNAPDLTVIPMDQKFIVHISNPTNSNNYLEQYEQEDYLNIGTEYEDKFYRFQGYQVYQVKNEDVTLDQLRDPSYAKIVFQCDLKDEVGDLVNYTFDQEIGGHYPTVMVNANNDGIRHTFEITKDFFAESSGGQLVNNKEYYYVAIAYAHNNYKDYSQTDTAGFDGQTQPYLSSRKATTGEIPVYDVIPHPRNMDNGGTELNANYGIQPAITKVEGAGNGQNYLKLADGVEDSIVAGYELDGIRYQQGHGPINVKIINPLNITAGTYYVGICADSVHYPAPLDDYFYEQSGEQYNASPYDGFIKDSKWYIAQRNNFGGLDTIAVSNTWMSEKNEILFDSLGISIDINQYGFPLHDHIKDVKLRHLIQFDINNGFLGANLYYEDPEMPWINFIQDQEGQSFLNWIRAGKTVYDDNPEWSDVAGLDTASYYENILNRTWAPWALATDHTHGPRLIGTSFSHTSQGVVLPSVNVVITKNQEKWTRVPVFEMSESPSNSEGGAERFELRAAPSLNKALESSTATGPSQNPEDANYVSDSGWSWFPGYAVDVETGKRLNMAFGESSWLVGYNGRDMIWNPVETIISEDGTYVMGGKHYLYVFASDSSSLDGRYLPPYEGLFEFRDKLESSLPSYRPFAQWISMPYTRTGKAFDTYDEMPDNDVRIELRTAIPFNQGLGNDAVDNPMNSNYPLYKFNLDEFVPVVGSKSVAEDALETVNVVPNPYYGGNTYESGQVDYVVKITNLPPTCSIDIYNMAGTLVRSYEKDNASTIIEWDLKNNYRVPIAGGLYIIHVKAPGIGEKTLKWFGVLRPDDLSSF